MNTVTYITAMQRPKMLYGYILRSTIAHGTITDIVLPDLSKDFLIITAGDIPGSNALRVFDEIVPLLSGEQISYRDQPILAVFGPDKESVTLAVSRIAVSYEASESFDPDPEETSTGRQRHISWGGPQEILQQAEDVVEYTYMTGSQRSPVGPPVGAFAEPTDAGMEITTSSMWPFHVRSTVSEVCGLPKRKVIIHQLPYTPTVGEHLIYPSIHAALAAAAASATGRPSRIIDPYPAFRPELIITRRTALNAEHLPSAESVDVQINQGAFPLFADEIIEHVIAGLTPSYGLDAFEATIHTVKTPAAPRSYYQGLCFPLALFSSEAHATNLALYSNMNPVNWRLRTLEDAVKRPAHVLRLRSVIMKDLLEQTVKRSDFSRKYAVYEMQKRRNRLISTFTGYSRGIGIASGRGINGFSTHFACERNYAVSVRLDVNDQVTITTSIMYSPAEVLWRTAAGTLLGIDPAQIQIRTSQNESANSGPDVLHRDSTIISVLITRCCESIKSQRFKEPLPITVKRSLKRAGVSAQEPVKRPLFHYVSWGALALELEIDPVLLRPVIYGVWCTLSCGSLFDEQAMTNTICSVIQDELTILTRSETGSITIDAIDIAFTVHEETLSVNPIPNVLGLLQAAYTSALTQAMNRSFTSIPSGPQEIFEAIGE
jgi:CO/xanthine dehydrogenase Mo-binding subunit